MENRPAAADQNAVSDDDAGFEFMLNALRLTDGFSRALFEDRTRLSLSVIRAGLDTAVDDGLLESAGDGRWRPTRRGFRFLNDLQARFLPS
jgi:oxygen-independent coproporphyrinogen-3 oxidase